MAITSTAFKSVEYHPLKRTLRVTFNDGSNHTYFGVTAKTYAEFEKAPSKGKFLNSVIRSSHRGGKDG